MGGKKRRRKEDDERREAELKAWQEQRERDSLERDMSTARDMFDSDKKQRFRNQRAQELLERDLNSHLLTVEHLEEEVMSENPEIEKRTVQYEDKEIPVFDLRGIPFSMLTHTVDYRRHNKPGEIGTETYLAVMDSPELWAERSDIAEQNSGFGTRQGNARGNTISASYTNSEHNLRSRVSGELVYGFDHVDADSIISVSNGDGATSNMVGKSDTSVRDHNAIKRLESAGNTPIYNEVLIRRYSENGIPKCPDYIVAENGRITETMLRHADYFGIPIINIETGIYREQLIKRGERKFMQKKSTKIILAVAAVVIGVIVVALIINATAKGGVEDEPTNVVSGETTKVDSSEKKLQIKDSGWSYIKSSYGGYISYGVEIYNPNEQYLASWPTIKYTGKDENGAILFTYDDLVDYIYPKETIYHGSTFNVDEKPATLEITVEAPSKKWENAKSANYPKNNTQIVSNVSERKDGDMRIYNGEIENTSDTDLSDDVIVVIFKKNDKIVGGNYTYSDDLDAGQKSTFTIYADHVPDYDKYEVSARVGSIN